MSAPARRFLFFFFNDTATTEIYTLSLHDALPICAHTRCEGRSPVGACAGQCHAHPGAAALVARRIAIRLGGVGMVQAAWVGHSPALPAKLHLHAVKIGRAHV